MRTRNLPLTRLLTVALLALAAARPARGQPCTITCPADIEKSHDPGRCDALISYPAPTTSGSCGTITTTPASGGFLYMGTHVVTATTSAGPSCIFIVRVVDTTPPGMACPGDQTVTAVGDLTPVSFSVPIFDICGLGELVCVPASGSLFPIGTTTVNCSTMDTSGNTASCSFEVNVVPPSDPGVTLTELPVIHPFPGTNINTGASFGQFDVFFNFLGSTKQFLIFDGGAYASSVDAQGFTASNCAPADVGVTCIGRAVSGQFAAAQVNLGGGDVPPTVTIHPFADQSLNFGQGAFLNGGADGVLCGETPADRKAFILGPSDQPFIVPLPSGATATEVFVTPDACVIPTVGHNTIFQIPKNHAPATFTDLSFPPGGGTAADDGALWISNAASGELVKIRRDGTEAGRFPLGKTLYRMSTLPTGEVTGWAPPRTFVVYNPTFNLGTSYVFLGTVSDIIDVKPTPRIPFAYLEWQFDPPSARYFARYLELAATSPGRPIYRGRGEGSVRVIDGR